MGRFGGWVAETYYRLLASCWPLRKLLRPKLPPTATATSGNEPLELEIVSHCWNYAGFLTYQLSSLVLHPPRKLRVRMTVFYAPDDQSTCEVLDFFAKKSVPNVRWNWRPLEKPQLLRRAIGRNMAALSTAANWIWFTDCDQVFHNGCLDAVGEALARSRDNLVFPREVGCTELLDGNDPIFGAVAAGPSVVDIDPARFFPKTHDKAVGALQIVRGTVARQLGYCKNVPLYMRPRVHWQKTYEDRMFRFQIGSQGEPIDVPGLYRIEHRSKGRYQARRWFRRAA